MTSKHRSVLTLAALVASASFARAQVGGYTTVRLVPGVARSAGAGGSYWRTTVWIANPSTEPSRLRVSYRPGAGSPIAADARTELTLSPDRSVTWSDVLQGLFGLEENTAGVLVIQVVAGDPIPVVAARTYTSREDGGTYGQYVPAIPPTNVATPTRAASVAFLPGLTGNDLFRSNVGFVNLSADDLTAVVTLRDADGAPTGVEVELAATAGTSIQQNRIDVAAGVSPLDLFTARVFSNGSGYGYASKIDQRTGDPVFIPAGLVARNEQLLDGVASTSGASGSFFRTTLVLANPSENAMAHVTVDYRPLGSTSVLASAEVDVPSGGAFLANDVLIDLLELANGNGTLIVRGDPVMAWARTFNDAPEGTFGQFIPAVAIDGALVPGATGYFVGLSSGTGSGFRTNAGFLNLGTGDATVHATAYNRGGQNVGEWSWPVPAATSARVSRIAGSIPGVGPLETVHLVMTVEGSGAAISAWVSIVDNLTGDAIFMPLLR